MQGSNAGRADASPLTRARWRLTDAADTMLSALFPGRARRLTPYIFLIPAFLIVGVIVAGLFYIGDSSLRVLDRSTFLQSEDYSLENYVNIYERAGYRSVLFRTFSGTAIVTITVLLLSFPYAYLMVRTQSSFLRKFLLFNLFLPFFLGQVVRAYGWLIILGQEGLVNGILGQLGLANISVLYTNTAVLIGLIQYMLPFGVLMLAPALTAIDSDIEAASEGLGAKWYQTLWHVVLPLAKPGFVAATVVVFTITLTEFAIPAILGGGTNDYVANAIYDAFFRVSDMGAGSALGVVLIVIGTTLVSVLFALMGTGTVGFLKEDK
ncbi:ABC transporter permease [Pelagibacterium montanilacus]|uniref:ABC transporter permease n=1 Tax=Pelagibacterium montanilacus TaxID=2185280 RepID=UPI000F8E5401|nr:ABC transporter permease [Pelagibacterium montanilacus]